MINPENGKKGISVSIIPLAIHFPFVSKGALSEVGFRIAVIKKH